MRALTAFLFVLLASGAAGAQDRAAAEIALPAAGERATSGPAVRTRGALSSGDTRRLLQNGFPARMHFRLERWKVGKWFDDLKATAEWDVVVRYDALAKKYQVYRILGRTTWLLGEFDDFPEAESSAGAAFIPAIGLPRPGERSYYSVVVDIETLSMSDLDEVEAWLRGELKPAMRGKKNPGTAVSRGVGTLVVRLMGGDKRRIEARSGKFTP